MKIGIIGSGIVGRVLGKAFLTEGHEVMLGTRNTSKEDVVKWKEQNSSANLAQVEERRVSKSRCIRCRGISGEATP